MNNCKVVLLDSSQTIIKYQGHAATGILIISSILEDNNIQHKILSLFPKNLNDSLTNCYSDIQNYNPKWLCFNTMCFNLPLVLSMANKVKRLLPGCKIILGGPEATFRDKEILENFDSVDMIMRNTAGVNIVEIIKNQKNLLKIKGITFKANNKIIRTDSFLEDIKNRPLPNYIKDENLDSSLPARVEISRGCPYKCTYCSTKNFWGHSIRIRPINEIIKEIKYLKHLGFREFKFTGDSFPLFQLNELYDELETLNISWGISTRLDWLNQKMITKLQKSGCKYIYLGIESGSQRILDLYKKNLKVEMVYEKIEAIVKANIFPKVSFIFGHPKETYEDISKTLKLITRLADLKNLEIQTFILSPISGSELFEEYKDEIKFDINSYISPLIADDDVFNLIKEDPILFSSFYRYNNAELDFGLLKSIQESFIIFASANPKMILEMSQDPLEVFKDYLLWENRNAIDNEDEEYFKHSLFPKFMKESYGLNIIE